MKLFRVQTRENHGYGAAVNNSRTGVLLHVQEGAKFNHSRVVLSRADAHNLISLLQWEVELIDERQVELGITLGSGASDEEIERIHARAW